MRLVASILAAFALLAIPAVAFAGCSPQHTVQAPQTPVPQADQGQPLQTPKPKTS